MWFHNIGFDHPPLPLRLEVAVDESRRRVGNVTPGPADPYLDLLEHRMVFYPRKEDPHCVSAILQEWDSGSIQLLSELMDVSLQLCKGCRGRDRMSKAK